jgi:hypothetical protein
MTGEHEGKRAELKGEYKDFNRGHNDRGTRGEEDEERRT